MVETGPPGTAPAQDPFVPLILLIVALAVGVRCFLLTAAATEEDFYITLRYAQNIAHGLGFVYNPGARILGTTTPLYTLLLALIIRLGIDPLWVAKLLGIAADGVSCYAIYRLGRAAGHPGAGIAAALCLAFLPVNLVWATKGMEVELVAAAGVVAWMAWMERREYLAWGACAVLALLRIDGLALAVFLLLGTLAWERRLPWRGLALFLLLLLPWLLFSTAYFGSPVPASVTAKLHVYAHSPSTRFPRLGEFVRLMTRNVGLLLLAGWVFATAGLIRYLVGRQRAGGRAGAPALPLVVPALWVLSYYASMALSPVFLFGWYFVPPTPIYYLIAMVGWSLALRRLWQGAGDSLDRRPGSGMALILAAAGLLGAVFVPRVLHDLREGQAANRTLNIPIGEWLHTHARPSDTVMLEPIGYIGYYGGMRVLDVVGLVTPEVLPYWDKQVYYPEFQIWRRFLPEWVLLRAGSWADLQRFEAALPPSARPTAHYTLAHTWPETNRPGILPSFYLYRRQDQAVPRIR